MNYAVYSNQEFVTKQEIKRKRKITSQMKKIAQISRKYDLHIEADKNGQYILSAVKKI
jgi:hypothetical protein